MHSFLGGLDYYLRHKCLQQVCDYMRPPQALPFPKHSLQSTPWPNGQL